MMRRNNNSVPTIVIAMLITAATLAQGQTYITSDITTLETWSVGCHPYIIQADVSVTGGHTLTIQAGVTVAFDGDYILDTDGNSAISAVGAAGNPVVFTSNAPAPAPGDWGWVQVHGTNQSTFVFCTFEYAEIGCRPNSASPMISHCTIRHCTSSGLFCAGASPTVTYCDIHDCRDGIGISGNTSNPIINHCNIHDNSHWNVYVFSFPAPEATINAEFNWWGTDDEAVIANEIRDSNDNEDIFVTIDYSPWEHGLSDEKMTWSSVKSIYAE